MTEEIVIQKISLKMSSYEFSLKHALVTGASGNERGLFFTFRMQLNQRKLRN